MQLRSDSRSIKMIHDRNRRAVGERSRSHFMMELQDKKQELELNREGIRKALNNGFEYDDTTRDGNAHTVHFINRKTGESKEFTFRFESNYARLNVFWWKRQ